MSLSLTLFQESPTEQVEIPAVKDASLVLTEEEISGFGRHLNLKGMSSTKTHVKVEKGLDLRMELRKHWFLSV